MCILFTYNMYIFRFIILLMYIILSNAHAVSFKALSKEYYFEVYKRGVAFVL